MIDSPSGEYDRDLATDPRITRPVHLTHPSLSEEIDDLVRPEPRAGRQ